MDSLGVRQFKASTGAETCLQICKIPLRKRTFKEHIAKKMSDRQQTHPVAGLLTFTMWLFVVHGMTCHSAQRINLKAVPMRERWDLLELPRLHPWSAARGARSLMWRSSVSGPFAQY